MKRSLVALGAAAIMAAAPNAVSAIPGSPASAPQAAAQCPAGLGIGLLQYPTALKNDPRAKIYVIDFVRPGTSFTRKFVVCNGTSRTQRVTLYSAGASIDNGSFNLDKGRSQNDLASWITISPSTVTLAPDQRFVAEAAFAVPRDAAKGEQYAGLVAELPLQDSGPVKQQSRVAVRVYLDVGSGGQPASDFTVRSLTAGRTPTGVPYVEALAVNTGGRALDMRGSLRLTDGPGGLSAGPFPAAVGTTIGIGQSAPVVVYLDRSIPAGPWHARIDLQSGLLQRAAEGTITFPAAAGTKAAPVKAKNISLAKNRHFLVPLAILLLLGIAIGIILFFWKRRKRKDEEEGEERGA